MVTNINLIGDLEERLEATPNITGAIREAAKSDSPYGPLVTGAVKGLGYLIAFGILYSLVNFGLPGINKNKVAEKAREKVPAAASILPANNNLDDNPVFGNGNALAEELTAELIKAEGDEYFKKSDYAHAVEKYNKALEKGLETTKDQYMTHLNLGFSLIELGKSKDASPHYEAAKKLGAPFVDTVPPKGSYKADYDKAMNFYDAGNYSESIDLLKKIRLEDPSNTTVLNSLGWAYKKSGNNERAKECFEEAIKINPLHWKLYVSLGEFFYDNNCFEKSNPLFNAALTVKPDMNNNYKKYILERLK